MPTGTATAYDLTVGVVVNMDEAIYMLSPTDTPLLTGMGADGLSVLGQESVDEIKIEWLTDTLLVPRSTLAVNATTGDTVITLASGDRTKFSTGDNITIQTAGRTTVETINVTGYGTTADTLLVSRAYGTAAATTYATSAVVIGVGTALAEGSDPQTARTVDRVAAFNYTQIFGPTKIAMSRTEQLVRKYGVTDEFTHQVMGRIQENAISREQAFLYGERTNSATTKIRTTGGLGYYITSQIDSTATQLTVLKVQTQLQNNYNAGGLPDRLIANPAALVDLNDIGNTSVVRQEIDDPRRGRTPVTVLWTEFGPMTVVRNRWCKTSDAFLIRREGVIRRVLRPLQLETLAKTGDADNAQIVCEEGLEVKSQEHMSRFCDLGY